MNIYIAFMPMCITKSVINISDNLYASWEIISSAAILSRFVPSCIFVVDKKGNFAYI